MCGGLPQLPLLFAAFSVKYLIEHKAKIGEEAV